MFMLRRNALITKLIYRYNLKHIHGEGMDKYSIATLYSTKKIRLDEEIFNE